MAGKINKNLEENKKKLYILPKGVNIDNDDFLPTNISLTIAVQILFYKLID